MFLPEAEDSEGVAEKEMRAGEKKKRGGIQHVTSGTPVNKHHPAGREMDAVSLTPSDHRPFVRFDPIRPAVDTENTILIFICIFTSLAGNTAAQNQPPTPSFIRSVSVDNNIGSERRREKGSLRSLSSHGPHRLSELIDDADLLLEMVGSEVEATQQLLPEKAVAEEDEQPG